MSDMTQTEVDAAWAAYATAASGGAPFEATVEAGFRAAYRAGRLAERQDFIDAIASAHHADKAAAAPPERPTCPPHNPTPKGTP